MDTFSALADLTRRNIIELLVKNGTLSVTEIASHFQKTQPAISQHLKVLREAELINMKKQAQKHVFTINPPKLLEVEGWIHTMTRVWDERFDTLQTLLKEDKREEVKKYD